MSSPRAAARTALALLCLIVTAWGTSAPAGAVVDADGQPPADPALSLVSLTGVLGPGAPEPRPPEDVDPSFFATPQRDPDRLSVTVRIRTTTATTTDLTVELEVFDRVRSRSALQAALAGDPPRRLASTRLPLGPPTTTSDPYVEATLELAGDALRWPGDGVHPIRITIEGDRRITHEVRTAVVRLSRPVAQPLPAMIALPFDAPPGGVGRHLARIERLVSAAERGGHVPLQLLVAAHVPEELHAEDPALLERMRRLAERGPAPVAAPAYSADLARLTRAGLQLDAVRYVVDGRQELGSALGTPPDARAIWLQGPTTAGVIRDVLSVGGAELAIAAPADRPSRRPLTTPSAISRASAEIARVTPDPWLAELWPGDGEAVDALAIQRVLAETAVLHLERPFDAARSVAIVPTPDWDPGDGVDRLLAALGSASWLEVVGASELPRAGARTGTLDPDATPLPERFVEELVAVRRDVLALRGSLAATEDPLDWTSLLADIDGLVSRWSLDHLGGASGQLATIRGRLDGVAGRVDLPAGAVVTLADREGPVPVTIRRADGPPIRLVVSVSAPPRLEFPEGRTRELVLGPGEAATVSFVTRAHATGRVPVQLQVHTADGALLLSTGQVVVRSTTVSGPALAALGAVLLGLLVWSARRRRRPREPDLVLVDAPEPHRVPS